MNFFRKIANWFYRKPQTKVAYIGAFTGLCTLVVIIIQTIIFTRQTSLLTKQEDIAKTQSNLMSNQIESTTRPNLDIQIISDDDGHDTLYIKNQGKYQVIDVEIQPLYFAFINNHGWYVSPVSNSVFPSNIDSGQTKTLDISLFPKFYKRPSTANAYVKDVQKEYLNYLITFSRKIDGKKYLCVLPGWLERIDSVVIRNEEQFAGDGPLSSACDEGLALTMFYLKKHPLNGEYELYSTGAVDLNCIGKIVWVN